MSDLATEIRRRHTQRTNGEGQEWCRRCLISWPCLDIRLADELDRLQAWAVQLHEALREQVIDYYGGDMSLPDKVCLLCREQWPAEAAEQHLEGCLATALTAPTAAGEEG